MDMQNAQDTGMGQVNLSMFDVYSGYVLTQGRNALIFVIMWERLMRMVAILALIVVAGFWLWPGAASGPQVVAFKLLMTGVLGGMAILLFVLTRSRPQYECQVDLIRGEIRQVMRAANGIEDLLMRVPFAAIDGLFVQSPRQGPGPCCLYLDLDGCDVPVLVGMGDAGTLRAIHRRISGDLAKDRRYGRRSGHPAVPMTSAVDAQLA